MAGENSAHRAPWGSIARPPTGFRRLTPGLLKADRTAEGFDGLSDGVASPGQLLAALKAAAPRLGISPRLVHALDWLFRFTQPQDWQRGSRPVVWPSAAMQQEALGLSERQVRRLNSALIEFGLVTMKDSPNGKRYGQRDPRGHIVEAYGFDLSPLAARHAEFVRLAAESRAERVAMARLRRRATIARKAIAQILDTATEYGFDDMEWRTLARATAEIVRALRGIERLDEMEAGVKELEGWQRAARERLETLLQDTKMTGSGVKNGPHQYTYNPTPDPKQDTVITSKECNSAAERPSVLSQPPEKRQRPEKAKAHGMVPDELVRLAPRLRSYLQRPDPSWPDLIEAADWLRHELGVSKSLWGEACLAMGRELAAMALAIVSTKEPGHFRTTPGGYFHGMVQKAKAGELHLERTVWALRHAAAPARDGHHR
ncbi:MAG TPA: plasmid replication protein RepC [Stellaceae bacterium]|nr:plasmid replication protein RepC [Stellaceae bacterium]